jgi:hypothetical protein
LPITLNEIVASSHGGTHLTRTTISVREMVRGASDMLGLEPLYVANEGKLLALVAASAAELPFEALESNPSRKDARIMGATSRLNIQVGWSCTLGRERRASSTCSREINCRESVKENACTKSACQLLETVGEEALRRPGEKIIAVGLRIGKRSSIERDALGIDPGNALREPRGRSCMASAPIELFAVRRRIRRCGL